jgi:isoaspartyl peptidase/L-asparaginase-like protein (Ntn-hydrolase superfamily)
VCNIHPTELLHVPSSKHTEVSGLASCHSLPSFLPWCEVYSKVWSLPVQGAGKDLKAVVNKMDVNDIKGNGQKSTDKDPGAGRDIMSNNEKMGDDDIIMDTVGAICIDYAGNLATGVSSGGIALKVKGRVGMAAAYGCGCWAGAKSKLSGISTACTFTGAGEQIVQSIAAHECCVLATQ